MTKSFVQIHACRGEKHPGSQDRFSTVLGRRFQGSSCPTTQIADLSDTDAAERVACLSPRSGCLSAVQSRDKDNLVSWLKLVLILALEFPVRVVDQNENTWTT
jgi:hypothetical protein